MMDDTCDPLQISLIQSPDICAPPMVQIFVMQTSFLSKNVPLGMCPTYFGSLKVCYFSKGERNIVNLFHWAQVSWDQSSHTIRKPGHSIIELS